MNVNAYILNFEDDALGNRGIVNYKTAHGEPLRNRFASSANAASFDRAALAQPAIIAPYTSAPRFESLEGQDDVVIDALIKEKGSFDMIIPAALQSCVPMAAHVGQDLLDIYGGEGFQDTEIILLFKHSVVPPGHAGRAEFAHTHNHLNNLNRYDLLYLFSNLLPTEMELGGRKKAAPENSLMRTGAEIDHLSVVNESGRPIDRTWGSFSVIPTQPSFLPMGELAGLTRSDPRYWMAAEAAETLLEHEAISRFETPIPLFAPEPGN